ncbi:MAG: EthD domain [Aeromicrobium sp.]|nr:EthD domain [Aeromicrobium sp.]
MPVPDVRPYPRSTVRALTSAPGWHDPERLRELVSELFGSGAAWVARLVPPRQESLTRNLDQQGLSLGPALPTHAIGLDVPGLGADEAVALTGAVGARLGTGWCWVTEQHVFVESDAARPDAVYRFAMARRMAHLDHEQFRSHYLQTHAPLVVAQGPLFDRYVVSMIDDEQWDAVAEQRFADFDTWAEHDRQIFEDKPAVRADLPNFLGGVVQLAAVDRLEVQV